MRTTIRIFAAVILLAAATVITGCGKSEEHDGMNSETRGRDIDSSLVRDYSVDIASLDGNGDGNVFQCPMDWNVISDTAGSCPVCMMDLEQYSVSEAQKNLEENSPHNH